MTRKPAKPVGDDNLGAIQLTRRMILEKIRRKESLSGLDMRSMDLSDLAFDGLDLSLAKLGNSNLARCSFRKTNLQGASLWHANLTSAVFDGANLEEADLDLANLNGATFKGARARRTIFPFNQVSLEKIQESMKTGCPIEMDHKDEGEE